MGNVKITAPVSSFTGVGPGGVAFSKGVAEVPDSEKGLLAYFRSAGYGIGAEKAAAPATQPNNSLPVGAPLVTSGTPTRDAAVEPDESDFLPPVNAGEAPATGPEVVAPGLGGVTARNARTSRVR